MSDVRFRYTIPYVADPRAAAAFYVHAFGFTIRLDTDQYVELDTGEVVLGFASHAMGASGLGGAYIHADESELPLGVELAFSTADVAVAVADAVSAGATLLAPPEQKPWGQTVAHLRDPSGILFELGTPVG